MKLTLRFYIACIFSGIGIKLIDNGVGETAYWILIIGIFFLLLECIMQMRIEKNKRDRAIEREYERYLRDYRGQ